MKLNTSNISVSEELEEALSTAVSLSTAEQQKGIAQWMLRRTIAAAGQQALSLNPQALIPYKQLQKEV